MKLEWETCAVMSIEEHPISDFNALFSSFVSYFAPPSLDYI